VRELWVEVNEVYPRLVKQPGKDWRNFPGAHLVRAGLEDLGRGVETSEALLVASFASRLRRGGLEIPVHGVAEPEQRLYLLLAAREPDAAHGRYNALRRRLISFAHALECAS
jgi:hypothetical protein